MKVAVLLLATGCDRLFNLDYLYPPPDAAGLGDTSTPLDAAPCLDGTAYGLNGPSGEGLLSVCLPSTFPVPVSLTLPPTFNTAAGACSLYATVDSDGTQACVVVARTISVAMDSVGTGGRLPLVLLATDRIYVNNKIDLSAHNNGTIGAGSNWIDPTSMTTRCILAPGAPDPEGGGGGAGGSNGERGGDGGNGKGFGGPALPPYPIPTIHGGCPGSIGGRGGWAGTGGEGGGGGGAIYLIAGAAITIDALAVINASGAGGGGGLSSPTGGGGGGGGGAGGLIGLDAPAIVVAAGAKLVANGGGGGSGGSDTMSGYPGAQPIENRPDEPAPGGVQTNGTALVGGRGGSGYALTLDAQVGGSRNTGGGGGGGGGVIAIYAKMKSVPLGTISPPPIMP